MKKVKKENRGVPIPQPRTKLFIGSLVSKHPTESLCAYVKQYGPIIKMFIGQTLRESTFVSSQEIVDEICDEERFRKIVGDPLLEIREFAGDGLFTAHTFPEEKAEPNWGKAHRILMPIFCPQSIQSMFPDMLEITKQMLLKWERTGPEESFDVVDSMTRLTLDTIGLCLFHYRFNNFRHQDMHPFVRAMIEALKQSSELKRRSKVLKFFSPHRSNLYESNVASMLSTADEMIAGRRRAGPDGKVDDLLQKMLDGLDPVSNEGLDDQNIRYNMITFLIAGHETTSGLLSFTFYYLLKNPYVMKRAREEVDRVLGYRFPTIDDVPKFEYIDQILKESLRLQPTAPVFTVSPVEPTIVAGKYYFEPGERLTVLLPALHRDSKVWGADAEEFKPERMAPELWVKLPQNSWKPFGNGPRACIGRRFAWQEATIAIAMILQRFDLFMADPSYTLKANETLTIKPLGFSIRAQIRREYVANRPCPAG